MSSNSNQTAIHVGIIFVWGLLNVFSINSTITIFNKCLFFITSLILATLYVIYEHSKISQIQNNKEYISKGERHTSQILQLIPHYKFRKIRPNWLKNPKTGQNLELDFYCEELQLAVEYNGRQHRTMTEYFHNNFQDFMYQVWKDQFKQKCCQERNIQLIIISDEIKNIKNYLENHSVIKQKCLHTQMKK